MKKTKVCLTRKGDTVYLISELKQLGYRQEGLMLDGYPLSISLETGTYSSLFQPRAGGVLKVKLNSPLEIKAFILELGEADAGHPAT